MPLAIIVEERQSRPTFICDYCHKEIVNAFEGNYEWNASNDMKEVTDIKFLHKKCVRQYEKEFGRNGHHMGLHNLMVYLLNNLNLTPERLREAYENTADLSRI
ncbi:MAG: hypothetical protein SF339_06625 [Blastocatellia bacterium]|nr:hypothetical protein [Blastocatellia bacterium]